MLCQWIAFLAIAAFCGAILYQNMRTPDDYRYSRQLQCRICREIESSGEVGQAEREAFVESFYRRHYRCVQERTGP